MINDWLVATFGAGFWAVSNLMANAMILFAIVYVLHHALPWRKGSVLRNGPVAMARVSAWIVCTSLLVNVTETITGTAHIIPTDAMLKWGLFWFLAAFLWERAIRITKGEPIIQPRE